MRFLVVLCVFIIGLLVSACMAGTMTKSRGFYPVPLPEYLDSVYPAPNHVVSFDDYHANFGEEFAFPGMRVTVSGLYVDQPELKDSVNDPDLPQRVTLFINKQEVPRKSLTPQYGLTIVSLYDENDVYLGDVYTGPFYLSWEYPLEVGRHTALFQVQSNTGSLHEFEWQFEIVK
jgi:hypothetical protein